MLTSKQEAFCQAVVCGSSLSDAYRSAYSADKMEAASIHVKASELLANGKVSVRVAALRAELADKGLWRREDSIRAMIDVINYPDNQGCKISAVKILNEMHGFNAPIKTESKSEATVSHTMDFLDAIQSKIDATRNK